MNPNEALEILDQVAKMAPTTRDEHVRIQQASLTLKGYISSTEEKDMLIAQLRDDLKSQDEPQKLEEDQAE